MNYEEHEIPDDLKIGGILTVGSKWQVVIPKEVRDSLGIDTGSKLALIHSAQHQHMVIVKTDDLEKVVEYAKNKWIHIHI